MVNKKRVGMMVAVTLLTGVLHFFRLFFLVRRANREITQRSFDELATATRQIAKDLVDAANADQTILSAMAELIAGHDERDNDAVLRIMRTQGFGDIQVVKDHQDIPRVVFGTLCTEV